MVEIYRSTIAVHQGENEKQVGRSSSKTKLPVPTWRQLFYNPLSSSMAPWLIVKRAQNWDKHFFFKFKEGHLLHNDLFINQLKLDSACISKRFYKHIHDRCTLNWKQYIMLKFTPKWPHYERLLKHDFCKKKCLPCKLSLRYKSKFGRIQKHNTFTSKVTSLHLSSFHPQFVPDKTRSESAHK